MFISPIIAGRFMRQSCLRGLVFAVLLGLASGAAYAANLPYDFAGTCINDRGPLGVIDTTVVSITGMLELDRSEPAIAQQWNAAAVLTYSFTFDNFAIDHTNSTLSDSGGGNFRYTTTAFAPFSVGDGFITACAPQKLDQAILVTRAD